MTPHCFKRCVFVLKYNTWQTNIAAHKMPLSPVQIKHRESVSIYWNIEGS